MSESMSESRRAMIVEMAKSYLCRSEVSEFQFAAVVNVLEALGYLGETAASHIRDDVDELYPTPAPMPRLNLSSPVPEESA